MLLVAVTLVGLIVGDGLFVSWVLSDFHGLTAVLTDKLALSFIVDALLTLGILSVYFSRHPPGRFRWPWFVVFSLFGGLCFGVPFYWWLNKRGAASAA